MVCPRCGVGVQVLPLSARRRAASWRTARLHPRPGAGPPPGPRPPLPACPPPHASMHTTTPSTAKCVHLHQGHPNNPMHPSWQHETCSQLQDNRMCMLIAANTLNTGAELCFSLHASSLYFLLFRMHILLNALVRAPTVAISVDMCKHEADVQLEGFQAFHGGNGCSVAVGEAEGGAGQGGPEGLHICAGSECMCRAAHAPASAPQRAAAPAQVRAHAPGYSLQATPCNEAPLCPIVLVPTSQCATRWSSAQAPNKQTTAYSRHFCNIRGPACTCYTPPD